MFTVSVLFPLTGWNPHVLVDSTHVAKIACIRRRQLQYIILILSTFCTFCVYNSAFETHEYHRKYTTS